MGESVPEKREPKGHQVLKDSYINCDGLPLGALTPSLRLPSINDGGEL